MPFLFCVTLFVGAALLFAIQPMVGRMLLPYLGGSPAVWNTCMVFFQAGLLAGYLYAHLSARWLTTRRQAVVHMLVLGAAWLFLPIVVKQTAVVASEEPVAGLLSLLCLHVGLPFVVISATAPLLQRWFAATRNRSAGDPYFLYAASNLGSLLALLSYPLLVERETSLQQQSQGWAYLYIGFVVLMAICAGFVPNSPRLESGTDNKGPRSSGPGIWVLRSFIPSSLLLGVTSYLTTDIAPMPLLWVIPLALYLLTFIAAFSTWLRLPLQSIGRLLAIAVLALVLMLLIHASEPWWLVLPVHLVAFTLAALLCHGLLARDRPPAAQLTHFYLWIAVGGVLGGAFNALLAPLLFHKLGLVEYPLLLVTVCLLRPVPPTNRGWRPGDLLAPLAIGSATAALMAAALSSTWFGAQFRSFAAQSTLPESMVRSAVLFGVPVLAVYLLIDRPKRFALGLGALLLAGTLDPGPWGKTLLLERNYLGVVRVTADADGRFHRLVHGNTIHGQQGIGPSPRLAAACVAPLSGQPLLAGAALWVRESAWPMPSEPLTYYHPKGPVGDVFRRLVAAWKGPRRIGVVGLGVGSMAAYAKSDQEWAYFELDPAVIKIARDDRYFTFLRDCRAKSLDVVAGDARLKLAEWPDGHFDLLVLDAFSSDAIPFHLLTAEAFSLYQRKLAPGGVLLFHLSNRYLDLPPVVAKLASSRDLPWVSRVFEDLAISDDDRAAGKSPSIWAVTAANENDLGPLGRSPAYWSKIRIPPGATLWTDDRVDLLGAWRKSSAD